MSIKSIFLPEVIARIPSQINGELEIVKFMGELRLDCKGLTQSGSVMEKIWGNALSRLVPVDFKPQEILMLGVGAGSSLKTLRHKYKNAHLVGVEIDPTMVEVAHKYFGLDKLENVDVIVDDAVKYVNDLASDKHFDMVLMDCYLGDQIPQALEDLRLLNKLKIHTKYLLLNRLFWDHYQADTLTFINKLNGNFSVRTARTPSNLVVALD